MAADLKSAAAQPGLRWRSMLNQHVWQCCGTSSWIHCVQAHVVLTQTRTVQQRIEQTQQSAPHPPALRPSFLLAAISLT